MAIAAGFYCDEAEANSNGSFVCGHVLYGELRLSVSVPCSVGHEASCDAGVGELASTSDDAPVESD